MIARTLLALPFIAAIASCTNPLTIEGPSTTLLAPNGIEQVLELKEDHPWKGSRGGFMLHSRLTNRGDAPVTFRVRTCYLRHGVDVTSTPRMELLASAIPGCPSVPDVITLAPGETSGFMWFGGIIQDRGRYRISVRHSIEPEIWGTIDVTVR